MARIRHRGRRVGCAVPRLRALEAPLADIRFAAGISLQAFCALHIYQLDGLPEMHFFFSAVTMMIVYQDWSAMWPGVILIVMQHIVFAVLQNGGYGIHYFGEARATERAAALTRQLLASGRRQLLHGSVLWVTPRDATRRAASRRCHSQSST